MQERQKSLSAVDTSTGKTVIRATFLIMQSITARKEYKDEAFSSHTIHLPRFHFPKAECLGWAILCEATSAVSRRF